MDKDIAYLIKVRIDDSLTLCRFNQVCKAVNLHEIKILPNGKKHGMWKVYYENGQLKSEGTYKNGICHGFWRSYKENGDMKSVGTYGDEKN